MTTAPKKILYIVGVDEVGRGPLAGPVYVCGAMMKIDEYAKQKWTLKKVALTDSKKMTAHARATWFVEAKKMQKEGKLTFVIARRSARVIDTKGIAAAIRECIIEIFQKLHKKPDEVCIELDGSLYAPAEYENQKTYIKGDLKRKIISLASVIAKESRDAYMQQQHKKLPDYHWNQNKGYGTKLHRADIKKNGTTPLHRLSYLRRIIGSV